MRKLTRKDVLWLLWYSLFLLIGAIIWFFVKFYFTEITGIVLPWWTNVVSGFIMGFPIIWLARRFTKNVE